MSSNLINLLKNIPILNDVDEDDLADVVKNTTSKTYKKGEYIIREGEKGDTFYVIESGKAQVLRKNDQGEEKIIAVLYPDNFFGEMALLNDKPRNASIRCLEDCHIYIFKKKDFYSFLSL